VDVGSENLGWYGDSNRMWKQPDHYSEQQRIRSLAQALVAA
jgi:hypothetical protein